ncbi:nuclease-related domain-containing protein [Neisseria sp. CCUG12390]|uniref:nuclease-related domain-containing protein n=1 Tax=Neisseria sp. CCUG12390 TaxID=3392035 RepID=UPI003A0FBCD2
MTALIMPLVGFMFFLMLFALLIVFLLNGSSAAKPRKKYRDSQYARKPNPKSSLSREEKTQLKGAIGEQIIKVEVLSKLDPSRYRYFHNLIVPIGNGSTQIDNIIVSPYGIFVVEAKYFQGWIFGNAGQPKWTHTLPSGSKFTFQNPLWQNYKHIKALAALLKLPEKQFHSVVVFTHRHCRLKTEFPENVCPVRDFIAYVQKHQQEIFTIEQCADFCAVLSNPVYEATPERTEQHIQSLKNRKNVQTA